MRKIMLEHIMTTANHRSETKNRSPKKIRGTAGMYVDPIDRERWNIMSNRHSG